jgi:hypothetical protein
MRHNMKTKYRNVHLKFVHLWNRIQKHTPTDDRQRVLLLQCEVMWDILESVRILVEKDRGVAAFILTRSIFELLRSR